MLVIINVFEVKGSKFYYFPLCKAVGEQVIKVFMKMMMAFVRYEYARSLALPNEQKRTLLFVDAM